MSGTHTGNSQPSIDREEHRSVNGTNAKAVVAYGFDGVNILPSNADTTATRTDSVTTTSVTYVGRAAIGTATSSALWQVQKIDETTANTAIITWADGNASFDNVWDNRASLTYS